MGFKSGFFLGALAGAIAAALSSNQEMAEAPTGGSGEYGTDAEGGSQPQLRETLVKIRKQADEALANPQLKETLEKVRHQADEAMGVVRHQADEALASAKEAATEREKELRQRFDSLVHKSE